MLSICTYMYIVYTECMYLFHVFVYLHFVLIDVVIGVWINQNYASQSVLVVFPHHPAT